MTEAQEKTRKLRLALICTGIVALLGLSIYSAHLLLNKPYLFVQEEFHPVVLPSAPKSTYSTPVIPRSTHRSTYTYRPTTVYRPARYVRQQSSSAPMHVFQTSSSTIHNVGGGGGTGWLGGSGSSAPRGIATTSSVGYTGMIYLATPHNAITSVGAGYAEEVVNEKMGIVARRMKAEDGWSEENDGPLLDPPIPTPVGATPLLLMLLLAGAYVVYKRRRTTTPDA